MLWHWLASTPKPSPKLWMNAYLAAFAGSAGLRFVTTDRDLRLFIPPGPDLELIGAS